VTRRVLPAFQRDVVCLLFGAAWGTWTVYSEGPWQTLVISAALMMGPGFVKLWLSGPGTRASLLSPPPDSPALPPSESSGPSSTSAAEA
jgi:hypothetical protein